MFFSYITNIRNSMLCVTCVYLRDVTWFFFIFALECELSQCLLFLFIHLFIFVLLLVFIFDRSARTASHIRSICDCLMSQSAQQRVGTKLAALASSVVVASMTPSSILGRREVSGLRISGDKQQKQPANLISSSVLVLVWRSVKVVH